eukprot:10514236-Alexandrium_andersonii.AAC.1
MAMRKRSVQRFRDRDTCAAGGRTAVAFLVSVGLPAGDPEEEAAQFRRALTGPSARSGHGLR